MRLLITTQAVDLDDPVLGFFHRWIEEFAKHCESVSVICLKEGRHNLPKNVSVYSLGKEGGVSRFKYVVRFYKYIWALRGEYDAVFAHMNQEYVLLGGVFWRMWGKRIILWRNHKMGSWKTHVAAYIAHTVCFTSPATYVAGFKNAVKMPIGIDIRVFVPQTEKPTPSSILFLGRIDEVKKPLIFIDALKQLLREGVDFHADIYGDPTYQNDPFFTAFKLAVQPLVDTGHVTLYSSIANDQTPTIYAQHAIYVNVTPSGSFDKTIGEAMACGCIVVVANEILRGVIPDPLIVADSADSTARGIRVAFNFSELEREDVVHASRRYIEHEHSLTYLVGRLQSILGV